jgi:palmitoyltransferase
MYKKKDEERNSANQDAIGLLAHAEHIETEEEEEGLKRSSSIAVLNVDQQTDEPQQYLSSREQPITVKRDGARRYCQKCKLEKFDRTHHCRQCGKCVLKMDQ